MTPKLRSALFAGALALAIAVLYSFGLNNQLLFDDARLTDGTVFGQYGSLMQLKVRMLSYGSFVWIRDILGEGWLIQRAFNIALHIVTAVTLYAFTLELLGLTQETRVNAAQKQSAAIMGVAFWALNPAAVYAVAYLIQRSILLATLCVAVACLGFVKGLRSGRLVWLALALACYVLAVAAKEHAVTAILIAVPLYIFVKRPPVRQILLVATGATLMLGLVGWLLYRQYGSIIGTVFDETSLAFLRQLEQQQPGIGQHIYPLSVINQMALFFQYGMLWLLPYVGWMSIDLRPAFPVSFTSAHLIGAVGWVVLLAGSAWLVVRRQDRWGLVGLALLMPALMFITEFATVWLQDPFVLYRSYLWAVSIPVLLASLVLTHTGKQRLAAALIVLAALAASSFERIQSLRTPMTAWADASAKVDLHGPNNAVGRWRPFLNQGAEALDRDNYEEALRLFSQAEALGESMGSARFNIGVCLHQLKKYPEAIDQFAAAEAKGFKEAALYYQRGESQFAIRRFAEAYTSFSAAAGLPQVPEAEEFTRLRQAEAAIASQKYDEAITLYEALRKQSPDKQRYTVGLSMAHVGKKDYQAALDILNPAIAKRPTGPAHYGRALALFYLGKRTESQQDLQIALRTEPNNPSYRQLQQMMAQPTTAPPAPAAAAKPASKP
jgi:tetratricopeptide (TPR) repeat protein